VLNQSSEAVKMNLEKVIRQAMLDNNIKGIMQLCERTGVSYTDVFKMLKNNGSVKLVKVIKVLDYLNVKIKFVSKGE
tara:strand:- start:69 stop:299 length:231 start_codon:yes stop_codon:yes gene_type:complete